MNKTIKYYKLIIIFMIILSCFFLIYTMTINKYADMSKYKTYSSEMDNMYINYTVKQLDKDINDKKSRIVYFGFNDCPYCNDLLPILTDINSHFKQEIYYIDTRKNPDWKSNLDIDDYDLLLTHIGKYLNKDEDNKLHLYVPTIIFINEGKIIKFISPYEYDVDEGLPRDIELDMYHDIDTSFQKYMEVTSEK